MEIRKGERKKAKARIAFASPSGGGKTMSSLLVAYGITHDWSKIAVIDTEHNSAELYINFDNDDKGIHIGEYFIVEVEEPYTPEKYKQAIKLCEDAGIEVIIIDSLSHAWAGEGGMLDIQGKIADSGKRNSYTAWRNVTPKHNALVEKMLGSKCHIIATMRSKTEYMQSTGTNGKTEVKKVGMAPIQRDGMEYEFTIFFDIDNVTHNANASKDRTGMFDGLYFIPTVETGEKLSAWLNAGKDVVVPVQAQPEPPERKETASVVEIGAATANGTAENKEPIAEGNGASSAAVAPGNPLEPFESTNSSVDNLLFCVQLIGDAVTIAEKEAAWLKVIESDSFKALDETQQTALREKDHLLWCVLLINDSTTILELETAWQKIKASDNYKALGEDQQKEVRKKANAKKVSLQKNGKAAAAA